MQLIEKLQSIIDSSDKIVLFSGAGMSVPSGIPDFRSAHGLYHTPTGGEYAAEEIISHPFFMSKTYEFYDFYKSKMCYPKALPNAAHTYFAALEKRKKLIATITQNIDGLHQAAGAKKVYELHGSVHRNFCMRCGESFDLEYVVTNAGVPLCDKCGGRIKPDVVLYGENLDWDVMEKAIRAVENADTLIVVGTSLVVYPAAGLIDYFKGDNLVLINKGDTAYDSRATLAIHEDCAEVCKALR